MKQNLLQANQETINRLNQSLDQLEVKLLEFQIHEELAQELMEIGYWANELLQSRVSYVEQQRFLEIIRRVTHLQMLFFQSVLDLRARELTKELKDLISEEAWRVYLRLDEIYTMEKEFFEDKNYHYDFNMNLLNLEQEVFARYMNLKVRVY